MWIPQQVGRLVQLPHHTHCTVSIRVDAILQVVKDSVHVHLPTTDAENRISKLALVCLWLTGAGIFGSGVRGAVE